MLNLVNTQRFGLFCNVELFKSFVADTYKSYLCPEDYPCTERKHCIDCDHTIKAFLSYTSGEGDTIVVHFTLSGIVGEYEITATTLPVGMTLINREGNNYIYDLNGNITGDIIFTVTDEGCTILKTVTFDFS